MTLEESYARCKALNRRYGATYYWAAQTLPRVKRHHVHALYGFCRYADDIVDELSPAPPAARAEALGRLGDRLFADLADGRSTHPVLGAVVHTANAFGLDEELFDRFLRSMTMDLSVSSYETWVDLLGYMDGSAAVIGEMMLPILEPSDPDAARAHARDLGLAFQLTNFLRDVGEDLDRGRVYLPQEDLRRFGVEPSRRLVDEPWRELMRFQFERADALYASADIGIALLPASSAAPIAAARRLYSQILARIEANDFDVFRRRAVVPLARKLAVAAQAAAAARSRTRRGASGASMP